MLTCKVGEKVINCFDGTYDKYQLKKWSDKNILICPDCGKSYEYCHGKVVPPYFRHKEKSECDGLFSEPETKEHLEGKKLLYNWLRQFEDQTIIKNLRLEGYIPETKQRPDIYFEYNEKRFVVELQCSPIATEYLERHELYQLANINDIWILGIDKYNFQIGEDYVLHNKYYKTIEKHTSLYFNYRNSKVYIKNPYIYNYLKHKKLNLNEYCVYSLEDMIVTENGLELNGKVIQDLKILDEKKYLDNIEKYLEEERQRKLEEEMITKRKELVNNLNLLHKSDEYKFRFSYRNGNQMYYLWGIEFSSDIRDLVFFIKDNSIDCCATYRKRLGKIGYSNIDSLSSKNLSETDIESFVLKHTLPTIETYHRIFIEKQEFKDKYSRIYGEYLNSKIRLINSSKIKLNENIRFKFLKDFKVTDEYMENVFIKELKFLNRKNVEEYIFMIPRYHNYYNNLGFNKYVRVADFNDKILKHFKKYGFTDVGYINISQQ